MAETNFSPQLGEVFEVTSSQVNLFRGINSPGYVIGDIAITPAGATYEWDGDSWNSISFGGGGGAAQTPWAQDIQGAGFDLLNVRDITATRNITAEGRLGAFDTTRVGDTDNEWYWKAEDAGMSLYGTGSGGTFKYMSISDPNEGMVLHGSYSFHAAGFDGTALNISGAVVTFGGLAGTGGYLLIDGAGSVTKGAAASLAANTFTALQTITQASANAGILASTGYSLTGSNATSMLDLAGTWNTSGNPVALKLAISNTASGATAKFLSFLAGAAGATEVFSVSKDGGLTLSDSITMAVGKLIQGAAGITNATGALTFRHANGDDVRVQNNTSAIPVLSFYSSAALLTAFYAEAANTLALRNSTTAQGVRIYNSFTTLNTSGEWLKLDWKITANQCRIGTVMGSSAGTARVLSLDYGALESSPTAAITIPITSGNIVFGGGVQLSNTAATETITPDKTLTLYDATGTAYKVPCVAA